MHLHNIHSHSRLARCSFWLRLEGGKQLINMVNPGEFFFFLFRNESHTV